MLRTLRQARALQQRTLASLAAPLEILTLANGLRVVTDATPGHFSALGAYVDVGTRYETKQTSGLTHMLDRMAWKSTLRKLGQQMVNDLARLGGNYMSSAQREVAMYQASVFNPHVEQMFECIAGTVRDPRLTDTEVLEAKATVAYELEELVDNAELFLQDLLHAAAYGDRTLGMPLYGSAEALAAASRADVAAFHQQFYRPDRIVLALVGVDHSAAVDMAQRHWGDWTAQGSVAEAPSAVYTGGELAVPAQPPRYSNLPQLTHMQVAFETSGLLSEDLYALATLQKLLGGGLSFSSGGPGKGMFLRLFRVLSRNPFVENCQSFHHAHLDLGLFGISILCFEGSEEYMAQIVADEFAKVMGDPKDPDPITLRELRRAKNQLTSSLLMNVESKISTLEDIGRQVQCQGKVTSVDSMVAKIEALSVADVVRVARKVFLGQGRTTQGSRPTVVMQGDRARFGDVEFVLRLFGLGLWADPMPKTPRRYSSLTGKAKWF